jgi:alpha-L-rhamnosidase
MKSLKLSLLLLFVFGSIYSQDIAVNNLTTEHKKNPVGIDVLQPRLSWKIYGTGNNIMQISYSIRVATDQIFSSGKMV